MELKEGYKQTEVGIIPEDWLVMPISEAFEICNNLRLPISANNRQMMQGEYPYYGPTKIQDHIDEYRVDGEYALIGEDGDHFLKWEKTPMTQYAKGKFNVNNHAHVLKGIEGLTDTKWFYNFFKHRNISQYLTRQGAGRYKLSKSSLKRILCAIPPTVDEQQNISNLLSSIDSLIHSLEQLTEKKRLIKKGAMQELLTGKRRLQGFESQKIYKKTEIGIIPQDWGIGQIGNLTVKVGSGITPTGGAKTYKSYGRPFVRSQNVGWGELYLNELAYIDEATHAKFQSTEIMESDVLLNITGASIGRSALADDRIANGNVNQHVCIIRPATEHLSPFYLNYFLLSSHGQRQIDAFQAGGNRQGLNFGQIKSILLCLPKTVEEQNAIANTLKQFDTEVLGLEKKLEKYKKIKQGMMQNLLTGKIRLTKPATTESPNDVKLF